MSEEQTCQENKENVAGGFLIWSQKSHEGTGTILQGSRLRFKGRGYGACLSMVEVSMHLGP